MGTTGSDVTPEKKDNKSKIIIIVMAIVVLALVGVILFILLRPKNSGREVGSVRTIVDEGSAEDVIGKMREEVEEGMFECQMSMTWNFDSVKAQSRDAFVANSTNNRHPFYFDVILDGSEQVLYSSPVLPVGASVNDIAFNDDVELQPGEYTATVMYNILDNEEDQNVISTAGFVVTIKILN